MDGLEELYTIRGILADTNEDGYADYVNGQVVLPEKAGLAARKTAINLCARIGYETMGMELPILSFSRCTSNAETVTICIADEAKQLDYNQARLQLVDEKNSKCVELISGSSEALVWGGEYLYARLPFVWTVGERETKLSDVLNIIKEKTGAASAHVCSLLFDCRYKGVRCCEVVVHDEDEMLTRKWKSTICEMDLSYIAELRVKTQHEIITIKGSELEDAVGDGHKTRGERLIVVPPNRIDIDGIFGIGGLLADTDRDFMPDQLLAKLVIPDDADNEITMAAANLAGRLGFETLGLTFPFVYSSGEVVDDGRITVHIVRGDKDEITVENKTDNIPSLIVSGRGDVFAAVQDCYQNLFHAIKEQIRRHLCPVVKEEKVWEKEFRFAWEGDKLLVLLEEKVFPSLKMGDTVEVFGLISEEQPVREALADSIKQKVIELTGKTCNTKLFCAYKQGFSWLSEDVVPNIKKFCPHGIGNITIYFRPFLKPGQTEWHDTEGAVPSFTAHTAEAGKWFDLPIRWLQELYPIDDVIAGELGIERALVNFVLKEDGETYTVVVKDTGGNVLYTDGFEVCCAERPYLDAYPDIGLVHPPTGKVSVRVNGAEVFQAYIKTDLEEVWDVYQHDILSKCAEYVLAKSGGQPQKSQQPLFKELRLEIHASEPDFELGFRQDMISSLDALHEDIYFVGLDFFKTMGERLNGEPLGEPGLILPCIKKKAGSSPYLKAVLTAEQESQDCSRATILVKRVSFHAGKLVEIVFRIDTDECYEKIKSRLEGKKIIGGLSEPTIVTFEICAADKQEIWNPEVLYHPQQKAQDGICAVPDIPLDHVIGYDEYVKIMGKFQDAGLRAWCVSHSYQGRAIYAAELTVPFKTALVSTMKLINAKPVYMLINRHHANEVSSTNAALLLMSDFMTDPQLAALLKKVNLAVIPYENVDGGNIHHELQTVNPKWKLHVARYNAVGREFAWDYWKKSQYGESMAMPRLWHKWLPDMVVDNHGVPTHEWDQPFSGYVSPWFKGFWLPRALFYGYFWYVDSKDYPKHKGLNQSIMETVATALNDDKEIAGWNAEWRDRFEKYAHQWLPKLFPADYYENMIFYWLPYAPNPQGRFASHRYPWITAVDWTTEVADETAQGEYLKLCIKTHYAADLAVIRRLSTVMPEMKDDSQEREGGIMLKQLRKRPLNL